MNFTINRTKWARGANDGKPILLLDMAFKSDCVGLFMLSLGIEPKKLLGFATPAEVFDDGFRNVDSEPLDFLIMTRKYRDKESGLSHVNFYSSALCEQLQKVNDDPKISDADREAKITNLFLQAGLGVEFTSPLVDRLSAFINELDDSDRSEGLLKGILYCVAGAIISGTLPHFSSFVGCFAGRAQETLDSVQSTVQS